VDHRVPLKLHTELAFEGMLCHVEEVIGQGSNAIVYKGWYPDKLNPDQHHHVLIKELFPFHPQGKIWRGADGGIVVDPEARAHWDTHRESFLAGNEVHLRLLADHPDMVGGNLNSFFANGTLYSLLGYSGGRSLQAELNTSGHDLRRHTRLMLRLLEALEAFHKSGYLHLDISPDNIMLVGSGDSERIFLIDFNSAHVIGSRENAYLSCKIGYSAPEVETGDPDAIGFASDLYSVAAVFYRCLMGRSLTLEETLRPKAPDGKDSLCLKDMQETVVSMAGRILKKGLHTLPEKRYRSIGQMRLAFAELMDRIDCVGVTHWSLWENGKQSVEELIRVNPSLRYVKEANKLYPIRLKGGESVTLSRYLEETLSPEGSSSLIVAQGGMGKTTLLLHTAMLHSKRYSPSSPAVFYISLNGWKVSNTNYIKNQILMSLRFKREMNDYDSAMHALQQLLQQPLKTRTGEVPAVLLLLDGLNEIRGEATALIREIQELRGLAGVRIIATSRNEMPALQLKTAELTPLEIEDIEAALGRNGLLIPQKQDVLQLLRTPLILSIYIQASEAGKQLDIETEEELMHAYMDALLQKELKQLPKNAPEKWQIDVALNYVLPAIAAEVKKKNRPLTERHLLKVVKKCQKTLRSWLAQKVFPQWIGHMRDIFHGTAGADEWFAVIIHELLWQRLGVLAKDAHGKYHIFHQAVSDYLARVYHALAPRLRYSANPATIVALIWCVIQLYTSCESYVDTLLSEVRSVSYSFAGSRLMAIDESFNDAISAVNMYLNTPDDATYQSARSIINRVLTEFPEQFASYEQFEEKERFFTRTDYFGKIRVDVSGLDEWILVRSGKDPQYLNEPSLGYIESRPIIESFPITDYTYMVCSLDVFLENYHNSKVSLEDVVEIVNLLERIHNNRNELLGFLSDYYAGRYRGEESQIEDMRQTLEALSSTLGDILNTYPQELYQQISKRYNKFYYHDFDWEDYTEELIFPAQLPASYIEPDWIPDNWQYYRLSMDPFFLDITTDPYDPQETVPAIFPFAVYTVSYGVLSDELLAYLNMLANEDIPYEVNEQSGIIQVFVDFEESYLTINWTELKTVLILTGIN